MKKTFYLLSILFFWDFVFLAIVLGNWNPDKVFTAFLVFSLVFPILAPLAVLPASKIWVKILTYPLLLILWCLPSSGNIYLVRHHLVDYSFVPSTSMDPTYEQRETVFYSRIGKVELGDTAIFSGWGEKNELMMKRIVGRKKDQIRYTATQIERNGEAIPQQPCNLYPEAKREGQRYLMETLEGHSYCVNVGELTDYAEEDRFWHDLQVEDDYFVVGDNRLRSYDSRSPDWNFPLKDSNLEGKVIGKSNSSFWTNLRGFSKSAMKAQKN